MVISKIEIGGKIYDAVLDKNGEAVQLSRYDERHGILVTLCFDNTRDGSVSDELLKHLKSRYLNSF